MREEQSRSDEGAQAPRPMIRARLLQWLRLVPATPSRVPGVEYHEDRARQEQSLARRAACAKARDVHLRLAMMHRAAQNVVDARKARRRDLDNAEEVAGLLRFALLPGRDDPIDRSMLSRMA